MLVEFSPTQATGEIAAQAAECFAQWNDSDPPLPSPIIRSCAALLDGGELLVALKQDEGNDGLLAALNYEQFAIPEIENRNLEMSLHTSYDFLDAFIIS